MGRYITYSDLAARYADIDRISSADVDSYHIVFAENELDGMLSSRFTVPFSSNNLTAKDLSMDLAYLRVGNFSIENRKILRDEVMARIERLKRGSEDMLLDDGTTLQTVGETVWSNTQDYHPVFGMHDSKWLSISSEQLEDEEDERE